MNGRNIAVSLLSILVVCCFAVQAAWATDEPFDPLRQITSSFPGSVKLNEKRRVMEFCPDETCDGFVASSDVSVATLKDFAYLYIYFFSEYLVYLPEWRSHDEARNTAEHVLSKPEYLSCKRGSSREAARCVLLYLSRNGKIKLLFIRYDEGQRNVVRENIAGQLAEKKAVPKQ
jgi:hypothetical protein